MTYTKVVILYLPCFLTLCSLGCYTGDFVIIGMLVVKVNVLLYPVRDCQWQFSYVMFIVYLLSVLVRKPDNLVVARGMVLLWRCSTALSNLLPSARTSSEFDCELVSREPRLFLSGDRKHGYVTLHKYLHRLRH